jgi:hypothetical protein
MEWIKCSDRLPQHEEIVDIYVKPRLGYSYRAIDCMYCDYEEDKGNSKHFYDEEHDNIYTLKKATHWMPTPKPPTE